MTDDWNWNPTIKTADGEEITEDIEYTPPPHRRKEVLESLKERGLLAKEMAEELDVSVSVLRRHMKRQGVELPGGREHENYSKLTRDLHDDVGLEWGVNQWGHDGEGRVERMADGGHDLADAIAWLCEMYECPDCGRQHPTRKGQHDCMREHSKKLADQMADDNEALP